MTGARQCEVLGLADRFHLLGWVCTSASIPPARSRPPWSAHSTGLLPWTCKILSALSLEEPVVILNGAA
jgi:hypothetical protein